MATDSFRARLTPARVRRLANEVGKFGVIGAVSFLVDFAIFNWLVFGLDLASIRAKTISTLIAMTIAYFGNRLWTWRDRRRVGFRREYVLFGLVNGGGLIIQLAILGFTVYVLDRRGPLAQNIAANVVGLVLGTLFRFWAYRNWVFPREQAAVPPIDDGALEATTITPY